MKAATWMNVCPTVEVGEAVLVRGWVSPVRSTTRGCIHVGRIGCSPPTLPSRIQPLNMEGAVRVMRWVVNTRLAVKRWVAYTLLTRILPHRPYS